MLSNLVEFFGRTHLVTLHFPIALIACAAMVESGRLAYFKLSRQNVAELFGPSQAGGVMVGLSMVSVVYVVVAGLVFGFDYGSDVDLHRILGLVSAVLVVIACGTMLIALRRGSFRASLVYLVMLCVSALGVSVTGHFGGELTHGRGFLTEPLVEMFAERVEPVEVELSEMGISAAAAERFETMVLPIFEDSCTKCHGRKKQKGDIRLDSLAFVLDPDFAIVDRESPEESEILYRLSLDPSDEDAMPPEEKGDPLSSEQVEAIRSWIGLLGP